MIFVNLAENNQKKKQNKTTLNTLTQNKFDFYRV